MKTLNQLVRPNILNLAPYSCARDEFKGREARVFLDANESPYNSPYNRYPDPLQLALKEKLSRIKGVSVENMCLGNGSDEMIDLAYRCFCRPGIDNVVAIEPTYGMYKVCADINNVEYLKVLLDDNYQLSADAILAACNGNTKLIWICSPNNPTGNLMNVEEVEKVLRQFAGIVVVDEAYSDFTKARPWRSRLAEFPNIIVLNTMSKAWGCAAIRLGMAFASKDIIDIFNKVKYPYNVNDLTQNMAMKRLSDSFEVEKWVRTIIDERDRMVMAFRLLPICKKVYPTDANFFLAKVSDATKIYNYLIDKGIVVRNRTNVMLCDNCLRITVGSKTENNELLSALRQYFD